MFFIVKNKNESADTLNKDLQNVQTELINGKLPTILTFLNDLKMLFSEKVTNLLIIQLSLTTHLCLVHPA